MRSLTAGQVTTLEGADYRVALQLVIGGIDHTMWLREVNWSSTIDQPTDELQAVLGREDEGGTLSPLIVGNVDVGHAVVLSAATVPLSQTPDAGDYVEVFRGTIDDVEWGGKEARLIMSCRDLGGLLQDLMIEEVRTYGTHPDTVLDPETDVDLLQDVIQEVLDDNGTGVSLTTVGDPEAGVYAYAQARQPVMDAVQALSQTIGWTLRYEYGADHVSRFTLRSPERDATVPLWTFGPGDYRDVTRLDMAREDVRNVITVEYPDEDGEMASVTVSDAASITRYGRRAFPITEGSESPIRTAAQALALANAALADLKDPMAEQEIETLFFWPVQLGDLLRFTANGVHYAADQDWAVVGYRHTLTQNEHRTRITVRGRPAGGYLTWLARRKPVPLWGPKISHREVLDIDRADVWVRAESPVREHTRLWFRDPLEAPENGYPPEWRSVLGADATVDESELDPLTLPPGEEFDPFTWFWNGKDREDPLLEQKLRLIPIPADGVRVIEVQGQDASGRTTGWEPLILTAAEEVEELRLRRVTVDVLPDGRGRIRWIRGALVSAVWVWNTLLEQGSATDPWPDVGVDPPDTVLETEDEYITDVVPDGDARYVTLVPVAADPSQRGPETRVVLLPEGTPGNALTNVSLRVRHDDGSVSVAVSGSPLAGSYRYELAVGDDDPDWPPDAEVLLGTVRTMTNGFDAWNLPAGTVEPGEALRFRAVAYVAADGTGEPGNIMAAEVERVAYRPAALEIDNIVFDEEEDEVTVTIRLADADGVATSVHARTIAGGEPPTVYALLSDAPTDGATWDVVVPLVEGHQGTADFRLTQVLGGQTYRSHTTAGPFSWGRAPDGVLAPRITESGALSTYTLGNHDAASVRLAHGLTPPDEAAIVLTDAVNGRRLAPTNWGTLRTLSLGDEGHLAAIFYSGLDGTGEASGIIRASAIFLTIQPSFSTLNEEVIDVAGTKYGRYRVLWTDRAALGLEVRYRVKEGPTTTETAVAWSVAPVVDDVPFDGAEYQQDAELVEEYDSWVEFQGLYNYRGDTETTRSRSPSFDPLGMPRLTSLVALLTGVDGDSGSAHAMGNFHAAALRIRGLTGVEPTEGQVEGQAPIEHVGGQWLPSLIGQLALVEPGETLHVAAFVYSDAAGTEDKSVLYRHQIRRPDDPTVPPTPQGMVRIDGDRFVQVPPDLEGGPYTFELHLSYGDDVKSIQITYGDAEATTPAGPSSSFFVDVSAAGFVVLSLPADNPNSSAQWPEDYDGRVQITATGYDDVGGVNGTGDELSSHTRQFPVRADGYGFWTLAGDSGQGQIGAQQSVQILGSGAISTSLVDGTMTLGGVPGAGTAGQVLRSTGSAWASAQLQIGDVGGNLPANRVAAGQFGAGAFTFNGDLLFAGIRNVTTNTSDGSDNASLMFAGGGASGDARGGWIGLWGNEHASAPGDVRIDAGNVAGASIRLRAAGAERVRITSRVLIGTTANGNAATGGFRATGTSQIDGDLHLSGALVGPGSVPLYDFYGHWEIALEGEATGEEVESTQVLRLVGGANVTIARTAAREYTFTVPLSSYTWQIGADSGAPRQVDSTDTLTITGGTAVTATVSDGAPGHQVSIDLSIGSGANQVAAGNHSHSLGDLSGNLPASKVSAGQFGAGDYVFSGRVRVGAASAASPSIYTTSATLWLGPTTSNVIGFSVNGTERMRLTPTGVLLIGVITVDNAAPGGFRSGNTSQIDGDLYLGGTLQTGTVPWARLTDLPEFYQYWRLAAGGDGATPDDITDKTYVRFAAGSNISITQGTDPIEGGIVLTIAANVGVYEGWFVTDGTTPSQVGSGESVTFVGAGGITVSQSNRQVTISGSNGGVAAHASSHHQGGTDPLTLASIAGELPMSRVTGDLAASRIGPGNFGDTGDFNFADNRLKHGGQLVPSYSYSTTQRTDTPPREGHIHVVYAA